MTDDALKEFPSKDLNALSLRGITWGTSATSREQSEPVTAMQRESAQSSSRPQHTWPAVLTLYFLAPFIAEMLTGSTPPLMWNNVGGVILTTGLYGSGALLARELVRWRGLGWGNLALLGVAYGVLEEGMAVQSWFNPTWIDPPDRLRLFEVNWTLALIFTTIHVTLSIMGSVVIAEALFPKLAQRPWLGQKAFVGLTLWLGAVTLWLFVTYGFILYHGKGYDHPPLSYGIALVLFALFLWLGLHRRRANASPAAEPGYAQVLKRASLRAPRLWTLRLVGFAAAFAVLVNLFILRTLIPIALVPIGIVVGVVLVGLLVVRRWSHRSNWDASHRLALASGVLGFFIVCSPLFEFVIPAPGKDMRGLVLVDALALIGLIWLAWRVKRQGDVAVPGSSPNFPPSRPGQGTASPGTPY